MISDYFPKEKRATALSIYSAGLYIGGGLSLPVGGLISSRWNIVYPHAGDAPLGLVGWQAARSQLGFNGHPTVIYVRTSEPALEDVRAVLPATLHPADPGAVRRSLSRPHH